MAYTVDMVYTDSMVSHCWHVGMGALRMKRVKRGLGKVKGVRWLRRLTGLMWTYIYIVVWLERHGKRLYGVMGLLSKKSSDGLDERPLDCYDLSSSCSANNFFQSFIGKSGYRWKRKETHQPTSTQF